MTLFDLQSVMDDSVSLQIEFTRKSSIWMTSGLLWTLDESVRGMPIEKIKQNPGGGLLIRLGSIEEVFK